MCPSNSVCCLKSLSLTLEGYHNSRSLYRDRTHKRSPIGAHGDHDTLFCYRKRWHCGFHMLMGVTSPGG